MLLTLRLLTSRLTRWITWCLTCTARSLGLHLIPSKHKHRVHGALLGIIAWDLIHAGFKLADMGFLVLSVLMEAEDTKPQAQSQDPASPFHVNSFTLDSIITDHPLVIPDAEVLAARLTAWLAKRDIRVRQWTDAPADYRKVDNGKSAAMTWSSTSSRARDSIAIRDDASITPSIYLYLLLHEASHAIGRVPKETIDLQTTIKALRKQSPSLDDINLPPMPCWLNPGSMITAGLMKAITQAGETEAEQTVRAIMVRRGWPTGIADAYLDNWRGTIIPPCLRPSIMQAATELDHAMGSQADHAS